MSTRSRRRGDARDRRREVDYCGPQTSAGFAYLSWIHFVDGNGMTETASIADDEKRGYLNLDAILFALFALGVSERVSPSVVLNGFWNSFASAGVMIAFGFLAIVNLVMYWSTNDQCHGESDRTTKDAPGLRIL